MSNYCFGGGASAASRGFGRRSVLQAAVFCVAAGLGSSANAGSATYVGSATDTNWNDSLNWQPNIPNEGDDVIISDTTAQQTLTLNDASHAVGLFQYGTSGTRNTPAFTVAGTNTLTINGGVTANPASTVTGIFLTLNTPVTIGGDQTWTVGGSAGNVATDAGVDLSSASSSLTFNGKITKMGTGQLLFVGRNFGDGSIDINAGSVKLNAGSGVLLTVGGAGTLTVNTGGTLLIAKNSGTLNMTKAIAVNAGGTLSAGGNQPNVTFNIGSPIAWGTGTMSLTSESANATEIPNFTGQWSGTGVNINLTSSATRQLDVSADNTGLTGDINNSTVLAVGSDTALGSMVYHASSTASVLKSVDSTPHTISSVIDIANNTTFGDATTGTGALTFTSTATVGGRTGFAIGSQSKTLTILNTKTTISGNVTGGPSANAVTKAGAGVLEFSGANSYDRPTTVTAGTLLISGSGTVGVAHNAQTVTIGDNALLDLEAAGLSDKSALNVTSTDPTAEVNIAAGLNNTISSLIINGTSYGPGTYGSLTSGAADAGLGSPNDIFSGNGILTVTTPEPTSATIFGAAAAIGLLRRRRRV